MHWGDSQQYHAEPHANYAGPEKGVLPKVHLLSMTSDPLGTVAACVKMYKGEVVRDLADLTDDEREDAFVQVQQTHLTMPLESIKMHFMIEGVDRAFTHQLVRQRTAAYAQESLRFAVPGRLAEATTLPPSLQGTTGDPEALASGYGDKREQWRSVWDNAINTIDAAYHALVETGMPAEEARGLLPEAVATRTNFITDLRNLVDHAGNRLCTQAQFHWRLVFAEMIKAIREYGQGTPNAWQFERLAESNLFRPVCYQKGHCPFKADFDRGCTIRERVDAFSANGVPSTLWDEGADLGVRDVYTPADKVVPWSRTEDGHDIIPPINVAEWLANPAAARL